MTELRQDKVTGRWVIMSMGHAGQKATFSALSDRIRIEELPAKVGNCPFCSGNENMTPPETVVWREGEEEDADWKIRVVPGRYPVLTPDGNDPLAEQDGSGVRPAYGLHEIIIETPQHNLHPGRFTPEQMETVIEACHHRFVALSQNSGIRSIILFRNYKEEAGASLEHPHTQVVALPFIYPALKEELEGAHRYFLAEGGCVFCSILREELEAGERIVDVNDDFVALSPYAAGMPYETWILPRKHSPSFQDIRRDQAASLAAMLGEIMTRIFVSLDDPPYLYYLHSAPLTAVTPPYYHWHLEIVPRMMKVAGFEWRTGVFINTVPPEESARFLAQTKVETYA